MSDAGRTIRAYELAPRDGLDALVPATRTARVPGPGDVLVRVRAVSLNHRDLGLARAAAAAAGPPVIPVSDGSGEVVALGPDVEGVAVGDRVMGSFFQEWVTGPYEERYARSALGGAIDGMLAEEVVLRAEATVPVPQGWTHAEAATLPCAGVTAYSALFEGPRPLRPGETVLVLGTGGVSVFALQLGVATGARVIVTSSSDAKLARARALGAAAVVNYLATPRWHDEVLRLTDGRGADHVVEVIGALGPSLRALAVGGSLSVVGTNLAAEAAGLEHVPRTVLRKAALVRGVYVGSARTLRVLAGAMAVNGARPVVDREFAFGEARAAYEHLASGAHFAKVVVTV